VFVHGAAETDTAPHAFGWSANVLADNPVAKAGLMYRDAADSEPRDGQSRSG
jgi:hypothetical protein